MISRNDFNVLLLFWMIAGTSVSLLTRNLRKPLPGVYGVSIEVFCLKSTLIDCLREPVADFVSFRLLASLNRGF